MRSSQVMKPHTAVMAAAAVAAGHSWKVLSVPPMEVVMRQEAYWEGDRKDNRPKELGLLGSNSSAMYKRSLLSSTGPSMPLPAPSTCPRTGSALWVEAHLSDRKSDRGRKAKDLYGSVLHSDGKRRHRLWQEIYLSQRYDSALLERAKAGRGCGTAVPSQSSCSIVEASLPEAAKSVDSRTLIKSSPATEAQSLKDKFLDEDKIDFGFSADNMIQGCPGAIVPNTSTPIPFENEHFKGQVLLLVRPNALREKVANIKNLSSADEEVESMEKESRWKGHFDGTKLQFRIRMQFEFKSQPKSAIYFGVEAPKEIPMGFWVRQTVNFLFMVLKQLHPDAEYGLGRELSSGKEELEADALPHVLFPLWRVSDDLVVTPPGERAPDITSIELPEREEHRAERQRHRGKNPMFKQGYIYTMEFNSAFVDIINWKLVNIPGIKDHPLRSIWGEMPIRLVAYELEEQEDGSRRKNYYLSYGLSHRETVDFKETERAKTPSSTPPVRRRRPSVVAPTRLEEELEILLEPLTV